MQEGCAGTTNPVSLQRSVMEWQHAILTGTAEPLSCTFVSVFTYQVDLNRLSVNKQLVETKMFSFEHQFYNNLLRIISYIILALSFHVLLLIT